MKRVYNHVCFKPIKRMANTPWVLALGIALTLLVGSVAFVLFEGYTNPVDAFYFATTVLSTVGFGDLLPTSWGARLFTALYMLWSIFVLVPCAIANILDSIRVDEHKMTHAEQEWLFNAITLVATERGIELPPQPHDYE